VAYAGRRYAGGAYGGGLAEDIPDQDEPILAVEWSPTTGALEEPAWVDISGDVRFWDAQRGRSRELERFQPGRATVVLANRERQYDSVYAAGPNFGNIRPMRRIRIRETFNGVTYPVFDGFVDRWQLDYPGVGKDATATVTATDAFKIFARTDLPRSVYTAEVTDDAPEIWWRLDDQGYPAEVLDSSGNAHHGTTIGGVRFQQEPIVVNDLGQGIFTPKDSVNPEDKGIELVLASEGLTVNGTTPFAVEFWVRRNDRNAESGAGGLESYFFLTNAGGVATPIRFGLFISNADDSQLLWQAVNDAETLNWGVESNFNLALNTTYHVVAVHGADRVLRIYIDGVDVSQNTAGLSGNTTSGTITADTLSFLERGTITTPDAFTDEFAFYLGTVPTITRFAAHNTAGRAPWQGDDADARIIRVLDLADWPADRRELDDGDTTFQSTELRQTALEHLQKAAETEFGLLFIDRAGNVRFISKASQFARTPLPITFGDESPEIGYRAFTPDDGDEVIRTRATISRLNGVAQSEEDVDSEFGRFQFTLDGLLHDSDSYSLAYAGFIVTEYGEQKRRITSLTVGPPIDGEESVVYPAMLSPELGDAFTVVSRPIGGGDPFTQVCVVEGIQASGSPGGVRQTTFALSPEFTGSF
jgi:hypothetical protein